MEKGEKMEIRPKIEIMRVSSIERSNFRPLDGVQLRAAYSHIRIGTYCPEPEVSAPEHKPPAEHTKKDKKNFGPVSRLLRRCHHATSHLTTKSCDNIYSIHRNSNSLDWIIRRPSNNEKAFSKVRQSKSFDWRVGRPVNSNPDQLNWQNSSRSVEQLSRSVPLTPNNLPTPSTRSKIVALLKRLSPRMPRPGKGSLPSSPSAYPWIRVEYSSDTIDMNEDELHENDVSFQKEMQLNEMKKRMIRATSAYQMPSKDIHEPEVKPIQNEVKRKSDSCMNRVVHEDRGGEERRSRSKAGRSEVAGLGDSEDVSSTVTLVPEAGGADRTTRRSRPLSLAVQPLNYQRLDPDHNPAPLKHSNMTSQESIGSCSLDIEQSASDRSEATRRSLSEKTLHSLNLSCNGEADKLKNGNSEQTQKSSPNDKLTISNGHHASNEPDQLIAKKPSYLGLACSISGYSGITRYDSKLREGFRSRDSSPGTRLVNRDTSPAGFRSNEHLNVPSHHHPPKSQSISPLAMDRQNGFSNGLKETRRIESYAETKNFTDVVDKGMSHTVFPDFSPIRPVIRSPAKGGLNITQEDSFSSSYPNSSYRSSSRYVSSYTESSVTNGSSIEEHNNSTGSQKSFIQQRVERLYGPGALAQGFFFKRSAVTKSNTSDNSLNKSNNSNNSSLDNSHVEESLKNLPVLRHLRPEFRAQLPVVNQRRPTDGSEQVIKPLQRLSLSAKKDETKETPVIPPVIKETTSPYKTVQMSASETSLTDQQPAAPKVVLPVIEPSTNPSTKQATEAKEVQDEEKDGHYFMKLLEKERDRLLSLAESAEAELENTANLPEEAAGKLRSAAGKSRLLATQKMHQFMGLCQKNINQTPGEEFPTTNEDIAGFWDMVMLQVVQVNNLFEQIERLRSSQWKEVSLDVKPKSTTVTGSNSNGSKKRLPSTKAKSTTAASNNDAARKAREAREQSRRQMLEERRRAMRSQNAKNTTDSVEIFVPET